MIAMYRTQSSGTPAGTNDRLSRTENSAGAPLPYIPRRSLSAPRLQSVPQTLTPTFSPIQIILQEASPPQNALVRHGSSDSGSQGSPPSPSSPTKTGTSYLQPISSLKSSAANTDRPSIPTNAFDIRGEPVLNDESSNSSVRVPLPTASCISSSPSHPPIYTPGMPLKQVLKSLKLDAPQLKASSYSDMGVSTKTMTIPPVVRKKSGQLVKSSLKASRPAVRGNLSVVTGAVASKSEPTTPKAVHFDSHLEHVKLFLAEQKPLAVSRDGSPTDDTSGTETDFPSFIFGESSDEKKSQKKLVMTVVNMPPLTDQKANVTLVELVLSSDSASIIGKVRVRNLAYAKWVAIRFTFDDWQTTSEVSAKYVESSSSSYDIFSFTIRLDDLLTRIDGKTLMLAIKYAVVGREFWDNNRGHNYIATFSMVNPSSLPPIKVPNTSPSEPNINELQNLLEKMARAQEQDRITAASRREIPAAWKGQDPLSLRYDFKTSSKQPYNAPSVDSRIRTKSSPSLAAILSPPLSLGRSFMQRTIVQPKATLGSPRDRDNGYFPPAPYVSPEDLPFNVPSVSRVARNHHRGYFDIGVQPGSTLRRTQVGKIPDNSLSPVSPPAMESDQSTPSILSPSASSRSTTPSPTEVFHALDLPGIVNSDSETGDGTRYSEFLERFCFFTGSHNTSSADIPRKSFVLDPQRLAGPTTENESEDSSLRSGSATPTSVYLDIPEISTPVML